MKKLIVISLFASLVATSAFAKTEGSYVGIDLLNTKSVSQTRSNDSQDAASEESRQTSRNYGVGVNYKYAVNFNKFFVAPGIIIEDNRSKNDIGQGSSLKVKNRYGVKADVGYDVTDSIAPYLTLGYSAISYTSRFNGLTGREKKSATNYDWFYGAGVKFDVTSNVALNLEYNRQNFRAKVNTGSDSSLDTASYKTKLEIIKVGVSYKF